MSQKPVWNKSLTGLKWVKNRFEIIKNLKVIKGPNSSETSQNRFEDSHDNFKSIKNWFETCTRPQRYKTFYTCNLWMFAIEQRVLDTNAGNQQS